MRIDILFRNARVYNAYIREWTTRDVAVHKGRILYVGSQLESEFDAKTIIDCDGRPLIPGLIDIHLHIESTLCTPAEFGISVLKHGTTTVVSEPHEIASVFWTDGIQEMIRLSGDSPVDIFFGVPSSVPSTESAKETTGGRITPEDAVRLLKEHPEVICLGEVMDFAGLARMEAARSVEMINAVREIQPQAAIEGHCPSIRDLELAKVLFAGVDSDHCLQDPEGLKQRFEAGMFVEIQAKSVRPEITELLSDNRYEGLFSFVTDDVSPDILARSGHLDHVIRLALKQGMPLEKAVTASSMAPARRMGLRDRGAVSPGKLADLILLEDDGSEFRIKRIFRKGLEIDLDPAVRKKPSDGRFADRFRQSINVREEDIRPDMFRLETTDIADETVLLAMGKNRENTYTAEETIRLPVKNGVVLWERKKGNLVVVVDRYSGKAEYSKGFLTGCWFHHGAVATSHAHDHHNLLAAGDNAEDMELALKWVVRNQGGIIVVSNGRILSALKLPVGGILSEEPMARLAEKVESLTESMKTLGFEHANPFMSFTTLTLPVSPEVKITDKGIFRTSDGKRLNLFI